MWTVLEIKRVWWPKHEKIGIALALRVFKKYDLSFIPFGFTYTQAYIYIAYSFSFFGHQTRLILRTLWITKFQIQ